ncbi:hypothetical protein WDU94_010757 [Cyamophila willieti]
MATEGVPEAHSAQGQETRMYLPHIPGTAKQQDRGSAVNSIQCGEERAKPANITEGVHGYIKIRIPCECKILNGNQETIIHKQFPCDEQWTKNITIWHVIPGEWTQDKDDAMEIMKNSSMNYQDKLKKLMSENWNVKRKFPLNPKEEAAATEEEEDEFSYTRIKSKIQHYHMEWTTCIPRVLPYQVTPNFVKVYTKSTTISAVKTVKCAKKKWVEEERKHWFQKRDKIGEMKKLISSELMAKVSSLEYEVVEKNIAELARDEGHSHYLSCPRN